MFFSTYAAVLAGPVHHSLVVSGIPCQRKGRAGKFQLLLSRCGRSPLFPVPSQIRAGDSARSPRGAVAKSRRRARTWGRAWSLGASTHSVIGLSRGWTFWTWTFEVINFAITTHRLPFIIGWHFLRAEPVRIPFTHRVSVFAVVSCAAVGLTSFSTNRIKQRRWPVSIFITNFTKIDTTVHPHQ